MSSSDSGAPQPVTGHALQGDRAVRGFAREAAAVPGATGTPAAAPAPARARRVPGRWDDAAHDEGTPDSGAAPAPALAGRDGDVADPGWARDGEGTATAMLLPAQPVIAGNLGSIAAGGGLLAALGAGGGGGGAAAAAPAVVPAILRSLVVHDGLVAGASVYVDANGNGRAEDAEKIGTTDASGRLEIPSDLRAGNVLVAGGTNVDTGLPNTMVLVLPSGSLSAGTSVVSPLTTLVAAVQALAQQGGAPVAVAQAESLVKQALGIGASLSLAGFDPFAPANAGSADALAVQKAAAQLATVAGARATGEAGDGAFAVVAAYLLLFPGRKVDLGSAADLQSIFALPAAQAGELADIAANNRAIASANTAAAVAEAQKAGTVPVIDGLLFDTGSSATDRITADPRVKVAGANAGAALQLSADEGRTWVAAEAFQPASGAVHVVARLSYANGFTSAPSAPFAFTFDGSAPGQPALALAADTGASPTDRITSNGSVLVSGTIAGALVEYSTDQVHWSQVLPAAREGANVFYVRQSFPLTGAASAVGKLAFTLDTLVQGGTAHLAGNSEDFTNDTGIAGDDITANTQPVLSGKTEAGAVEVRVTIAGQSFVLTGTAIGADGSWSLQVPQDLPDGEHAVVVQVVDAAGNRGAPTTAGTVTVDTQAPSFASGGLAAASDSGTSPDDGLTNVVRPTIEGTAEAFAGVEVEVDGTVYATSADAQGRWSVVVTQPLTDGEYTPVITVTDRAGNTGEPVEGSTFTVLAPQLLEDFELTRAGLAQDEEFDTGVSSEDGVTQNTLPLLTGEVALGGVVVIVRFAGVTYVTTSDDAGAWSVQVPEGGELEDGTYVPGITYLDDAGNVIRTTGSPVVIDTTAPDAATAELVHDAQNDTGSSASDGITSNSSPLIRGTADPFAHILLDLNGNEFETDADAQGRWAILAEGLDDDEYLPLVTVTDLAGNVGDPIEGTAFTVDTEGPDAAEGALVHDDVNDTGIDPEDSITANNRPAFEGTAEPLAAVTLVIAGLRFSAPADEDGNWRIVPDRPIPDGTWTPVVEVADAVGNVTPAELDPIVVDTQAPSAQTVFGGLLHDEDNDTGASTEDGITANGAPVLFGLTDPLALVHVRVGDFQYDTQADEAGVWIVETDGLPDGDYTPLISVIDAAGNEGPAVAGEPFTIDTVVPDSAAGGLLHDAANDTGLSPADNVTGNPRPVLAGTAEAGATITLEIGDFTVDTVADAAGRWRVALPGDLEDGEYTPVVIVTDVAGNVADSVDLDTIVVDRTVAPAVGGITHDDVSDTGASTDDGITSNKRPSLSGEAEPFATVTVHVAGAALQTTADEDGLWSVDLASDLPDGTYVPRLTVTDVAGNSATADGESFTVVSNIVLPLFGAHQVFQVGQPVDFDAFPPGLSPDSELEDYGGGLAEGLAIDGGRVVGTPAVAGSTFLAVHAFDAAGNEATQYVQLVATAGTKFAGASSNTISNSDPEKASLYLGTDADQNFNVSASAGDVIFAGGGKDLVRVFFEAALGFSRVDGGAGDDQLFFGVAGLDLDFSDYNNPDGNGQVIERVESFFFSGTGTSVHVTAADLLHLRSDVFDVDGVHRLVRLQANPSNGGTVDIEGLAQVGAAGAWGANGGPTSGASSDKYSKFTGVVNEGGIDHLVELLVQNGLQGVVSA